MATPPEGPERARKSRLPLVILVTAIVLVAAGLITSIREGKISHPFRACAFALSTPLAAMTDSRVRPATRSKMAGCSFLRTAS